MAVKMKYQNMANPIPDISFPDYEDVRISVGRLQNNKTVGANEFSRKALASTQNTVGLKHTRRLEAKCDLLIPE